MHACISFILNMKNNFSLINCKQKSSTQRLCKFSRLLYTIATLHGLWVHKCQYSVRSLKNGQLSRIITYAHFLLRSKYPYRQMSLRRIYEVLSEVHFLVTVACISSVSKATEAKLALNIILPCVQRHSNLKFETFCVFKR